VIQSIGDALAWETLGPIRVKGRSEPMAIHCLAAARPRRSLRSLFEVSQQTPLVGREEELALVTEKIEQVAAGHGRVVGFTGEAGMGKSRLVAEVVRLADARGWQRYGCECSSYGTNTSYHAWFSIWWHFFELDPSWTLAAQIEALTRQLDQIDPALTPRLPLLGAALNLPIPDNELTASFDAKLRKSSLEALLVDCLRARSQQAPIVLISENCQWLDPLSYDLLEVVARAIVNMPVLLVLAYRPPELAYLLEPRVSGLAHYVDRELAPFTPQQAESLIIYKLSRDFGEAVSIPEELIARITERSGGNPFYIDELLTYLQAQGIDPQDRQALAQLDLPTSLQSLILSRLDQLADNPRITLKVASVIGRSFEAATLWGFYPALGDSQQVKENLASLEQADLTFREAPEPDLTYAFRQVLTQEVSYESLPFATRAALHEQLGQFIETAYSHQLDQQLDRLAYHYGASQNDAKKREYLLKAGERAQRVYNNAAAINYFQRVLPLLENSEKVPVMLKLGQVLDLVGRWQEAGETLGLALRVAESLNDVRAIAQCETALGDHQRKRGLLQEALRWLEEAQIKFQALDDLEGYGRALHYAATATTLLANYQRARSLFEASMVVREQLGDQANIASLYSNLGIVARREGNNALARDHYEKSLEIRQKLGDRWAIGVSLNNLGHLALTENNYTEAQSQLERALAIWREVGDRWAVANTLLELGNLARERAHYTDAAAHYRESLTINQELNDRLAIAYLFEDIGCLAALQDAPRRALQLVAAATALRHATGAPLAPAEAMRLQEKLEAARQQLSVEDQQAAEAAGKALSFEQAIEMATHWTEN
jgi:predicted ATPase